jgi:hypothetical protein
MAAERDPALARLVSVPDAASAMDLDVGSLRLKRQPVAV